MKLFMATIPSVLNRLPKQYWNELPPYTLAAYPEAEQLPEETAYALHNSKLFILDSGAFTYLKAFKKKGIQNKAKLVEELEKLLVRYARFIRDNNVELYIEMDVDPVVGYERVLEYRKFLEKTTKRKCIPVWHIWRGKDEWKKLIRQYKLVAIGGFAIKVLDFMRDLPWLAKMVDEAHEHGCLVHGLGISDKKVLNMPIFDSIDSSTFGIIPARFGQFVAVTGNKVSHIRARGGGIPKVARILTSIKSWKMLVEKFDSEWNLEELRKFNQNVEV